MERALSVFMGQAMSACMRQAMSACMRQALSAFMGQAMTPREIEDQERLTGWRDDDDDDNDVGAAEGAFNSVCCVTPCWSPTLEVSTHPITAASKTLQRSQSLSMLCDVTLCSLYKFLYRSITTHSHGSLKLLKHCK